MLHIGEQSKLNNMKNYRNSIETVHSLACKSSMYTNLQHIQNNDINNLSYMHLDIFNMDTKEGQV